MQTFDLVKNFVPDMCKFFFVSHCCVLKLCVMLMHVTNVGSRVRLCSKCDCYVYLCKNQSFIDSSSIHLLMGNIFTDMKIIGPFFHAESTVF
jgi:hypothetical protein